MLQHSGTVGPRNHRYVEYTVWDKNITEIITLIKVAFPVKITVYIKRKMQTKLLVHQSRSEFLVSSLIIQKQMKK